MTKQQGPQTTWWIPILCAVIGIRATTASAESGARFHTAVKVSGSELHNVTVCVKGSDDGTCEKSGLFVKQTKGVADISFVEFSEYTRDDRYRLKDSVVARCLKWQEQWMCSEQKNGQLILSEDEADDAAKAGTLQARVEDELVKNQHGSLVVSVDRHMESHSYSRTYYFLAQENKSDRKDTLYCYTAQLSGIRLDDDRKPVGDKKTLGTKSQCIRRSEFGQWTVPPMPLHEIVEMKIVHTEKRISDPSSGPSQPIAGQ